MSLKRPRAPWLRPVGCRRRATYGRKAAIRCLHIPDYCLLSGTAWTTGGEASRSPRIRDERGRVAPVLCRPSPVQHHMRALFPFSPRAFYLLGWLPLRASADRNPEDLGSVIAGSEPETGAAAGPCERPDSCMEIPQPPSLSPTGPVIRPQNG